MHCWKAKVEVRYCSWQGAVGSTESDLKCRILVRMSSEMAHSRALSMEKRDHVPRRSNYDSHRNEVAGGPS